MHRAVVELDALANPDRPAAHHERAALTVRRGLRLLLPAGVVVGRGRLELGRAGVDQLVGGHRGLRPDAGELLDQGIREACPAHLGHVGGPLQLHDPEQPFEEPGIPATALRQLLRPGAAAQGVQEGEQAAVVGLVDQGRVVELGRRRLALLKRAQRLHESRLEGPLDGHHLARAGHLRAQVACAAGELVERPAGDLYDAVVEGRLEGGEGAAGDRVADLVQPLPDRDLGRGPGDRVAGGFGGQRRRPRDPRVDLDHVVGAAPGVQRELHVAAALDAQRADDAQRRGAQHLVVAVGERLGGCDHDRVARVHPHGVEVLHVADGDAGVGGVPHHLVLDLLPAPQRALDQHLVYGRGGQPAACHLLEVVAGAHEAAAGAAQGVGGPDHQRQAYLLGELEDLLQAVADRRGRNRLAYRLQHLLEGLAVLGLADRLLVGAQQAHAVAFQHAGLGQLHGQVQTGLPAQGG